jgi:hypothetical protein
MRPDRVGHFRLCIRCARAVARRRQRCGFVTLPSRGPLHITLSEANPSIPGSDQARSAAAVRVLLNARIELLERRGRRALKTNAVHRIGTCLARIYTDEPLARVSFAEAPYRE